MHEINILNISEPDVDNAAGIIPYLVHKELSNIYESTLVVTKTGRVAKNLISYANFDPKSYYEKKAIQKISRLFKRHVDTDPNYYFDYNYSDSMVDTDKLLKKAGNPDVIIAYFTQGFYSMSTLFELQKKTGAPILIYLMDMVYLTGGCHYSWDCEEYINNCNKCPAILDTKKRSIAFDRLTEHRNLIEEMNIIPVVPSEQLYQQTKSSRLFKNKKIKKILLGMDHSVFYKKNTNDLRDKYNIGIDKFVILFGAVNQTEKRKGWKYLQEVLASLYKKVPNSPNILLVSIGNGTVNDTPFEVRNFGYINSQEKLADMYNLASVFVVPSIQDSGPSMINQSISCGTPVISFNIGVSSDLIFNGKTGYRVKLYDSEAFSESIYKIYSSNKNKLWDMSENCIEIAKEKLTLEVQLNEFKKLIQGILK